VTRYGYQEEADVIQDLYLSGTATEPLPPLRMPLWTIWPWWAGRAGR